MSEETGERRPTGLQTTGTRPPEQELLPCPRCDSTNTKFCYYNNYNLSQPRYFCKACRRYWTRGGTLRNIPVGGGTRKSSSKRPRTAHTTANSVSPSSTSAINYDTMPANPVSVIPFMEPELGSVSGSQLGSEVNLNDTVSGSFTSLLNTTQAATGFVPFSGFELGLGSGLHGFGLGRWDWPMEHVAEGNGGVGSGNGGASSGCNTWQMDGVEAGLENGDCFGWPDLAISTPRKALR